MYHGLLVLEANMVVSVARRGHQQALWAILTLALPLSTSNPGFPFSCPWDIKILKPQAGGNGTRERVIRAQSGVDGGTSAP